MLLRQGLLQVGNLLQREFGSLSNLLRGEAYFEHLPRNSLLSFVLGFPFNFPHNGVIFSASLSCCSCCAESCGALIPNNRAVSPFCSSASGISWINCPVRSKT